MVVRLDPFGPDPVDGLSVGEGDPDFPLEVSAAGFSAGSLLEDFAAAGGTALGGDPELLE
jgi:hypothetical protein